jgi:hypothetical protein
MTVLNDDQIDELLRTRFAVPEDGFSAKVVRGLSRRRRSLVSGPMIGVFLGMAVCGLRLLTDGLLSSGSMGGVREPNTAEIVVWIAIGTGLSLLAMGWAIAEER